MESQDFDTQRFRSLPIYVIETRSGAVFRRGTTQLRVDGELAVHYVSSLVAALTGGAVLGEVLATFPAPHRECVRELMTELVAHRFLVPVEGVFSPAPETNQDVFYWQLGGGREASRRTLGERHFTVVGINRIGLDIAEGLAAAGAAVELVDYPRLRNNHYFDADGALRSEAYSKALPTPLDVSSWSEGQPSLDVLVAASDFGGLSEMRVWNELAIAYTCEFFPVVLQDMVGFVGPRVVPGETACFECYRARQNARDVDAAQSRLWESFAHGAQHVAAVHPSLCNATSSIALIELLRSYGGSIGVPRAGVALDVRLLDGTMSTHRVLKVPRCNVCSTLNRRVVRATDIDSPINAEAAE